MSIKKAAEKHGVPCQILGDRLSQTHGQKPGRLTVFTNSEEAMLRNCLQTVVDWRYPSSVIDFRLIIKGYLEIQGRNEKRFKSNVPGVDFIRSFAARNGFLSDELEISGDRLYLQLRWKQLDRCSRRETGHGSKGNETSSGVQQNDNVYDGLWQRCRWATPANDCSQSN